MSKSLLVLNPVETVACCSPLSREPLSQQQAEQIVPLLKALADPVRLRLMSLVASHDGGEACVCDLNDAFDLSQPTISHHLKVLHDAGLLDREKRGVWVYYRARTEALASLGTLIGDPSGMTSLGRRALAEFVGTAFLVAAVIGSGMAAVRLSPNDVGLQLLENSIITGAALVALILALQPVSAAFNPIVTLMERALGAVSNREAAALILAQFAGGTSGAMLANLMFGLPVVNLSTHHRSGSGVLLSEVVAMLGLLVIIFGTLRADRAGRDRVAFAVGSYILAAYWFTSSTSFANPAVTTARMFSNTFAGIAPSSVAPFILMQLVGGLLGYALIRALYPNPPALALEAVTTSDREAQP